MDKNTSARIIDELNERMEKALDNEENYQHKALSDFYEWFIESFIL